MDTTEKLEAYRKIIEKLQNDTKRPVCHLYLSKEPCSLFDSHMGGFPYCPHDAQLPEDDEGHQLYLCAQINFAQLPKMELFPRTGILQIFLSEFEKDGGFGLYGDEWTDQKNWHLLYHEQVDETVTLQEVQEKIRVDWDDQTPWRIPSLPLKIGFSAVSMEGISDDDHRFASLFEKTGAELFSPVGCPSDELEIYAIYDSCQTPEHRKQWGELKESTKGYGCKIGGFPAFEQEDVRLQDDDRKAWDILLLQIDDRDTVDNDPNAACLYLGGYGIANFWIRPEDLKNRDFSKVGGDWATS